MSGFQIRAFFFPEHAAMLDPYLEKTGEILSFYAQKFGQPIQDKFSIIEIGTGYGTGTSAPFGYAISSHLINESYPLIAHEIAHLWWGETVSDDLGKDTWLHEGLATFSDFLYRSEKAPDYQAKKRILFDWLNKAIPIGNPETLSILEGGERHAPERFLVYERAGFFVQTLKHIMGEEKFFDALRHYVREFKGKKADTQDFLHLMSSTYGRDLGWLFDYYLRGKKIPTYQARFDQSRNQALITISQQDVPEDFQMPITLEIHTNQRSFRREVTVTGNRKRLSCSLENEESILQVIIDPDFEVLGVREAIEDRWLARSLRLEVTKKKNFREIKPQLITLRDTYPGNVYILHELAQFYFAQKEWQKGIDIYERIVNLDPEGFAFIALANIAGAYETLGDSKMQQTYLEKALSRGSGMYSLMRSLKEKLDKLKLSLFP